MRVDDKVWRESFGGPGGVARCGSRVLATLKIYSEQEVIEYSIKKDDEYV